MMKSLLWKRIVELKNQKPRFIFSLILSVVVLLLSTFIFKNDFNMIFAYFPVALVAINYIFLSSMDDILFCETLISTNISLQKMWLFNMLFTGLGNYLISTFLLIITSLFLNVQPNAMSIFQNIFSLPLTVSLIGCASIHYANYSKLNQYIGTIFGVSFMVISFSFVKFVNLMPINQLTLISSIFVSFLGFIFSWAFISRSSKEKMLINTAKISAMIVNRKIDKE